ncbi:hypothetical protein SDC9_206179 [bioreactor metagenome]|uniref:Uncharacterized protein n=1 Tax=bioreactor metagenome TaxID=1076179 RepID=A0A645JDJ2_9ZZZZ
MVAVQTRDRVVDVDDCLFKLLGFKFFKLGEEVGKGDCRFLAITEIFGNLAALSDKLKALLPSYRDYIDLHGLTAQQ